MNEFFAPESLRSRTGGSFVVRPATVVRAEGVSIDTRALAPGQVFVALRGERADGHEFLAQAAAAGASCAIIEAGRLSREQCPRTLAVIEVPSTRAALLTLASAYRRTLRSTRVIAVTGSNGKTTAVRLIDAVLSRTLRGAASRKSFNNELGVPLTLLNTPPASQYLVCEIGMNAPGEIRRLAAVAAPDVAVVTSIGRAHIGRLGSVEAIAREKMSLLAELAPGGMAVVTDSPLAEDAGWTEDIAVVRFGLGDGADLRVSAVEADATGVSFVINDRRPFRVPLLGAHNALNAAAAIAVAGRFGLDDATIAAGLARAKGPEMRLDRVTIGDILVINDAYNANPDSVLAAVRGFASMAPDATRRVLVLGEMLELDDLSAPLHREVGDAVAALIDRGQGPHEVVLVGRGAWQAADPIRARLGVDRVRLEPEIGDGRSVAEAVRPGDAVLLKGSRGVALERAVDAIAAMHRKSPAGA